MLENKFNFNKGSQTILLNELDPVFSEEDNTLLLKKTRGEIKEIIKASNHHAAPGSDGITNYFYHKMLNVIGESLVKVLLVIFEHENPPLPKEHAIWCLQINLPKATLRN